MSDIFWEILIMTKKTKKLLLFFAKILSEFVRNFQKKSRRNDVPLERFVTALTSFFTEILEKNILFLFLQHIVWPT